MIEDTVVRCRFRQGTQDCANDVSTLAKAVLLGQATSPLILVIDDDDHVIRAKGRGLLDQGNLALQESIELRVTVMDRVAIGFPVFTAIRNYEIEIRHMPDGERPMEEAHRV